MLSHVQTTAAPAPPASTSAPAPPAQTSQVGSVGQFGQCGGAGYTGATACAAPFSCKALNGESPFKFSPRHFASLHIAHRTVLWSADYYSQCL